MIFLEITGVLFNGYFFLVPRYCQKDNKKKQDLRQQGNSIVSINRQPSTLLKAVLLWAQRAPRQIEEWKKGGIPQVFKPAIRKI